MFFPPSIPRRSGARAGGRQNPQERNGAQWGDSARPYKYLWFFIRVRRWARGKITNPPLNFPRGVLAANPDIYSRLWLPPGGAEHRCAKRALPHGGAEHRCAVYLQIPWARGDGAKVRSRPEPRAGFLIYCTLVLYRAATMTAGHRMAARNINGHRCGRGRARRPPLPRADDNLHSVYPPSTEAADRDTAG